MDLCNDWERWLAKILILPNNWLATLVGRNETKQTILFSLDAPTPSLTDGFPPGCLQDPPRWALQVLFSLRAVRFEFAEPPHPPASTMGSRASWRRELPSSRLDDLPWSVDPRLQTANNFFSHGNRPFRNACQLFACLCWNPLLVSRFFHPETCRILWLNDLKGGQEAPTRKTLQPIIFDKMKTYPKLNIITRGVSQENWISDY